MFAVVETAVDPEFVAVFVVAVFEVEPLVAAHPVLTAAVVGVVTVETWVAAILVAVDELEAVVVVVVVAAIEIPKAVIAAMLNAVVVIRARWAMRRPGRRGVGTEWSVIGIMVRPHGKTAPSPS